MPRSVAFGFKADLNPLIESVIDRDAFTICFVDFETAALSQFDLIVPLTLRDIRMLRQHHAAQSHKFLIPSGAVTALCHDKKALNDRLLGSGFAQLIPPVQETAARTLPYVLKKKGALSGHEIFVVRTPAEDALLAERLASDQYFCQTYVDSCIEYATHMLIAEGEVRYHSTNQYWMAPHAVKGNDAKPIREIVGLEIESGIIAELTGVARSIGFEGPCCMDYKLQAGQIRLMEINPRFGFSLFRDINRFLDAYAAALTARDRR